MKLRGWVITRRPLVLTRRVGLHFVSPREGTFLLNNCGDLISSLLHQSYLSLRSIFGPTVYSRPAAPGPELPRLVLGGTFQTRCQRWAGPLGKSSRTSDNYKMPGSRHCWSAGPTWEEEKIISTRSAHKIVRSHVHTAPTGEAKVPKEKRDLICQNHTNFRAKWSNEKKTDNIALCFSDNNICSLKTTWGEQKGLAFRSCGYLHKTGFIGKKDRC